jgi:hypothetical protein
MRRRSTLLRRGIWFEDREVGDKAKGDIVKTQEEHMHTARGSHRRDEATDLGIEHPTLDQEAIGRQAYFYWEERGCPNNSPDEDCFRTEAELRNRLAAIASNRGIFTTHGRDNNRD